MQLQKLICHIVSWVLFVSFYFFTIIHKEMLQIQEISLYPMQIIPKTDKQ